MNTVQVLGRFRDEQGNPLTGEIEFIPERVWVEYRGRHYPTMHVVQSLKEGVFKVELTPTNTEATSWRYWVKLAGNIWQIHVEGEGPLLLAKLMAKKPAP